MMVNFRVWIWKHKLLLMDKVWYNLVNCNPFALDSGSPALSPTPLK